MELKGAVINFLGDSITEGVGASCVENRYADVFARAFGVKVNNYGVSGSRFANQRINTGEIHERHFCMRAREMDESADAVVVFGATNDFGHGDAPIGSFEDRTPDTFYGACHDLMSYLISWITLWEPNAKTLEHAIDCDPSMNIKKSLECL